MICASDRAFARSAASRARAASASARAAAARAASGSGVADGEAVAGAVESEGDADGDEEPRADGEADGEADDERVAVGVGGGLADGVDVGPSAIAGVARYDATRATASSGGANKRCSSNSWQKNARDASETGHKSPQRACEPRSGLLADLTGRADPVRGDLASATGSKHTFGFSLAILGADRDHQSTRHERSRLIGAGTAGNDGDLIIREASLLESIDRGLSLVAAREHRDDGNVLARYLDLLRFVSSCFHHDLRLGGPQSPCQLHPGCHLTCPDRDREPVLRRWHRAVVVRRERACRVV